MLPDSVVVVSTRLRGIPLAMITMRKSTHGFPFISHIRDAYGAPLGGPKELRYQEKVRLHINRAQIRPNFGT